MLKRQRPISPPPSSPVIPIIDSPVYNTMSKRRRTMPPLLDGQWRGWAEKPDHDEEWSEEEFTSQEADSNNSNEQLDRLEEYRRTNVMLHELHTSQQHRLLSMLPPPSTCPDSNSSHISLPNSCSSFMPSNTHSRFQVPQSSQIPSAPERPKTTSKDSSHREINEWRPLEESVCVKERYEGTNRLLGSYVLSRRRQLDSHGNSHLTS